MTERIRQLETFLQQSPDDCFLNHALALEYIKLGDDEEAQRLFRKNLSQDPAYVATYYHLGKLLERLDAAEEAAALYEKGMEQARAVGDMHAYRELQAAFEDLTE
jgi:Tfp pilus assembly protein PilF